MPIITQCPNADCGKSFKLAEDQIGRRATCKKCGTRFRVRAGKGELISAGVVEGSGESPALAAPYPGTHHANEDDIPDDWNVGDTILDLYEVTGLLGEGGMGKVYKVHHNGWHVDLAVKSPRAEILVKKNAIENFEREAETWVNLGLHPHTVSCYYIRLLGGVPRVFAEYVAGGSLKDWIESGELYEGGHEDSLQRILDIAIQFAWGLHYAHEQGLIHQDVKPTNLMMTPGATAKVTDFGLAKAQAMAGELTASEGQSILVSSGGMTPAYCSPEQANGEKLTRKTDTWSWAVSVLEMFTGDVTWPSGTVAGEALESLLEMGSGDESIPAIPPSLVEVLRQCFQIDASQRPKDMWQAADRLQEIHDLSTGTKFGRSVPRPVDMMADSLNNRGTSLLDLGRKDAAEKVLEEALKSDPNHPEATFNLELLRWRDARTTDAQILIQLEEVGNARPGNRTVAYLQGLVHLERLDLPSAVEKFEEAQESLGGNEVESALAYARRLLPEAETFVRTLEGHTGTVSFSPDGRRFLSRGDDATLRLWEVSSGRCLRTFEGHTGTVSFSPDGRRFLSRGDDATLRLWEVSSGRCLRTFEGHTDAVESVSFSPDGRHCLSGSKDRTLRLWEVSSGRCLRTFEGHRWHVTSVSFSPDGRRFLSWGDDATLQLWEVSSGRCLRTFEGHTSTVCSASFSPDGRLCLSGSRDRTLRLWEVSSGRCLRTSKGHTGCVVSVSFSPDGRYCLSGSDDRTLRLWEVSSGRCLRTFEGHTGDVNSVGFSPDGRHCLSGSDDKTFRLWDVSLYFGHHQAVATVLSQPSDVEEVMQCERQFAELIDRVAHHHTRGDESTALKYLRDARGVPGKEYAQEVLNWNHTIGRYCKSQEFRNGWVQRTFQGHTDNVRSVTFSPDGRYCLSGSEDETLRLWEVSSGRCLRTFEGHTWRVTSVSFSPDGRYCLSGSWDNTLRLWEVSSGRCLRTFQGHTHIVTSVSFSPDGRYCLSVSGDNTLRLWEVSSGRCLRTFEGLSSWVESASFSPDGRLCLSGSEDRPLLLWEVSSGRCLRTFEGHPEGVNSVTFSPDGRYCLSGSEDNTLRLWEVSSGRCLRTFQGHTHIVTSVSFSPDGRYCLSGSWDNTLRLWEVSSGRCLRTFQGHTHIVTSVSFSPDGRYCLSGSEDRTLRLWRLEWDYEFPGRTDWDDNARPYLEHFLTIHCPPSDDGTANGNEPEWQPAEFEMLVEELQHRGLGYIRPEGVRKKLEQMAAEWTGPPSPPENDRSG